MSHFSHQPHVLDRRGRPKSQAAFPVCIYDGKQDGDEIDKEGYGGTAYCNKFQTTFNEHGMCYTYNNYELNLDKECKLCMTNSTSFFHIRVISLTD